MTKYNQYTMGQLKDMILNKYKYYLNSSKDVYIISDCIISKLDSVSIMDFAREELELILSNYLTTNPRLVVELDDINIIHDGSIEIYYHKNKKCVYTGRHNNSMKQVLLGNGELVWLPNSDITSEYTFRRNKMESLLREFPQQIAASGAMSLEEAQEAVSKYYGKYRKTGMSYGRESIKVGKYIVVLTFEKEESQYREYINTGAYPKLLIYKMTDKLKEETLSKIEELKLEVESKEERILLREIAHYISEHNYMPYFMFSRREHDHGGAEFGYHFNIWFAEKFEEPYRKILDLLGFKVYQEIYDKAWMIYGTK